MGFALIRLFKDMFGSLGTLWLASLEVKWVVWFPRLLALSHGIILKALMGLVPEEG
jgi:hypothetical protein